MSFLPDPNNLFSSVNIWLAVGLLGQMLFGARFVIQWIMSERIGRSIIPLPFWFCSFGGGVVLLSYAIHKEEIVFIIGQGMGLIIYVRNLFLIYREWRDGRINSYSD
jgi:lipid-A-disaccharide synthase-like uncharacterized protein